MHTKLTLKTLLDYRDEHGFYETIEYGKLFIDISYPSRPSKPSTKKLLSCLSSQEIKDYALEVEKYEEAEIIYNKDRKKYEAQQVEVNGILENFVKEEAGLNSVVPEKYRDKVYSKAYEYGHSSGWSEIYNYLLDFVDIFE